MATIGFSNIRLGWLQRFCAVAQHGNYARAGQDCNIDPTCVSDGVQSLERALGRMLIYPTTARVSAMGKAFLPTAQAIVGLTNISGRNVSNITIGALECLIAVCECDSYVAAARHLGCTRFKVMRTLNDLERSAEKQLLIINGRQLFVTAAGETLVSVSREVIYRLKKWENTDERLRHVDRRRRIKPWFLRMFG